mmetsp:Transcript_31255/g.101946  ORF Transcript_31255/g.101946 Transcript_31255/m.101946 type:complete len:197 (-) Transcript_31255:685-1275(-)
MSFFGLTGLGSENCFVSTAANSELRLSAITDEQYAAAFAKHCLDAATAEELQVEPSTYMRRCDLPKLLCYVLGVSTPTATEQDIFLTHFDSDTSGVVTLEEFQLGVAAMKKQALDPSKPKHYTSSIHFREDRHRHRRLDDNPQGYLTKPLTSSQEVGWHAVQAPAAGQTRKYFPLKQTEVTTHEGRSIGDYFGSLS